MFQSAFPTTVYVLMHLSRSQKPRGIHKTTGKFYLSFQEAQKALDELTPEKTLENTFDPELSLVIVECVMMGTNEYENK